MRTKKAKPDPEVWRTRCLARTPGILLTAEDYAAPATALAPRLLGAYLCRQTEEGVLRARIVETECYYGEADTACHAHKGRTARTETLYAAGGIAYVYLCYGMYDLLNVVTGPAEHPEAVLLRGVEDYLGPGRLTRAMGVDRNLNGAVLHPESGLWLEWGEPIDPSAVACAPRVGIDYADPADRERPWRFLLSEL
jgi:DNA-3-methyladenine glycosylase